MVFVVFYTLLIKYNDAFLKSYIHNFSSHCTPVFYISHYVML